MLSATDSPQVKVAKGAAIILAGLAFSRIVNYAYQIVLARAGGTEEFGLFFLGVTTIAAAGGLAALGLDLGVARFAPLYLGSQDLPRLRGMLRYSFGLSILTGAAGGLLLQLTGRWIALHFFNSEPLIGIFHICALCLPFTVSNRVLIKAVVAFQKIGYRVAVNQVASPLVRLVFTVMLVLAGMRAEGAMWAYLASEAVSWVILLWLLNSRVFPLFGKSEESGVFEFRPFFAYCLPLLLAGIIDLVLNNIDAVMTGYFLDKAQVGIYGTAVRLASMVALGIELLSPMFLSIITQAWASNNESIISATFSNNNRWYHYITLPATVLLVMLAPEIMVLFWGESFAPGAASLAFLTLGQAFYYLTSTSIFLLSMHGATRLILGINLIAAVLNIILNYILIPRLGISGAALATAVSLTVSGMLAIIAARYHHKGNGFRVFFPRIIAAAVVPAPVILLLKYRLLTGWPGLIAVPSAYLLLYLLLLKLFRVFTVDDRYIWRQIVVRLKMGNSD